MQTASRVRPPTLATSRVAAPDSLRQLAAPVLSDACDCEEQGACMLRLFSSKVACMLRLCSPRVHSPERDRVGSYVPPLCSSNDQCATALHWLRSQHSVGRGGCCGKVGWGCLLLWHRVGWYTSQLRPSRMLQNLNGMPTIQYKEVRHRGRDLRRLTPRQPSLSGSHPCTAWARTAQRWQIRSQLQHTGTGRVYTDRITEWVCRYGSPKMSQDIVGYSG